MLNFGNKEFRNLQEQVLKNMEDIQDIQQGTTVLADFGIKVIGQVDDASELPDPATYEGEYGDAYIVGTEEPYDYYIFTRAFEGQEEPTWFNLGVFPQPGPQGPIGATPQLSAFVSGTNTLAPGSNAYVGVGSSGTPEATTFSFLFGIPQGEKGDTGAQGIQGERGPQGEQGAIGPQGPQGQKGDPGMLYTIIGQVSSELDLPDPSTLERTSAYLVGASEPYDVYVILGEYPDFEWVNLGPIATVVPTTYDISLTYEESGTLDAQTLAAINAQTLIHYLKNGNVYFQSSFTLNGFGYYTAIGLNTADYSTEIGYLEVDLSDGTWSIIVNPVDQLNFKTIPQITSTTLTEAQIEAFRNGCIINGGITGISSNTTVAIPGFEYYGTLRGILIYETNIYSYIINLSNSVISRASNDIRIYAAAIGAAAVNPPSNNTGNIGGNTARWAAVYAHSLRPSTGGVVPLESTGCNLGNSSNRFTNAYLDGEIALYNTDRFVKIMRDNQYNLTIAESTDGTTNTYLYTFNNSSFGPRGSASRDLGYSNGKWRDLFLSRNLTDGTNSVTVANIAQKGQTLVTSGTFDSNGEFTVDLSQVTVSDGLYWFTYANAQAFIILTSSMVSTSGTNPIRTAMPVVYGANGETNPGTLRIQLVSASSLKVKVSTGSQNAREGLTCNIYKTNLV